MTSRLDLPFPDVPKRPLRAVRHMPPRYHDRQCPDAWVFISPPKWTDAQRERAQARVDYTGPIWPYTPDCPGCDDLTAWHQEHNHYHLTRLHRQGTLFS